MFTLALSCLTTSNLPWFMDLIFQVPMQYCSLQHRTLLLSPVTSTTGYCFCFGSIPLFFVELFLHWSPVAYWRVYNSIANTSKRVLFLPTSDVYVRSFLYLFYTLIKLYYTKALSDQVLSLALDWISLLWRPELLVSFMAQQQPFTVILVISLVSFLWLWFFIMFDCGFHSVPWVI